MCIAAKKGTWRISFHIAGFHKLNPLFDVGIEIAIVIMKRNIMNQLSIIYLIMGSVLLVGVMLISISPDSATVVNQKAGAVVGLSNINPRKAIAPGFGKISLYFAPNKGQLNDKAKFYTNTSPYSLGMTMEGLLFDIFRKARGEGVDRPRPFLPRGH
jgi:hypothetical protein